MPRPLPALAATLLLAGTLQAQAPTAKPAFEVATIKPVAPPTTDRILEGNVHVGINLDNARLDIGSLTLMQIMTYAYRVRPYQITGPDWMSTQRFDVLAKLPEGTTKDQVPQMLQALLVDRFKIASHRDMKTLSVYGLTVAKGGPKMLQVSHDSPADEGASLPGQNKVSVSEKNEGVTVSGTRMGTMRVNMGRDGILHMEAADATMQNLADMLSQFVDRPVVDMTELKGTYEVALEISPDDLHAAARAAGLATPPGGGDGGRGQATPVASDPGNSPIFTKIQQLGLKLESRKAPVNIMVIDHAEKTPTEN